MIDHGSSISVVLAAVKLLGDMNGFHLARNIRTYYPDIEVLLVSDDAESAEVASDLCDEGPMEKPYHPKEVLGGAFARFERGVSDSKRISRGSRCSGETRSNRHMEGILQIAIEWRLLIEMSREVFE
jgi:hypothetical protein